MISKHIGSDNNFKLIGANNYEKISWDNFVFIIRIMLIPYAIVYCVLILLYSQLFEKVEK